MSAVASARRPVNGLSSLPPGFNEAVEYEKILNLCQQISAGTHPRLKIPSQIDQSVPPPSLPSLPNPTSSVTAPHDARQQLPGLEPSGSLQAGPSRKPLDDARVPSHSAPLKSGPSEIDPIFLQKSEHLLNAEMKIQRDRLEKQLREQLDSKRNWARQHPPLADAKPDFDIAQILSKATELVRPIPVKEVRTDKTPSDSFDEDSFYSSKAPDSTPRGGDVIEESPHTGHQVQSIDIDDIDADGPVDHRNDVLYQADHANSSFRSKGPIKPPLTKVADTALSVPHVTIRESDESDEEPEYSPPEPTQFVDMRRDSEVETGNGHLNSRRQAYGRNTQRYENGRRYGSPSADVRIVRSHITSPVAPKPSRISPLAMAKAPPQLQNHHVRQEPTYSRQHLDPESLRTSPDAAPAPVQTRKRRKPREDGRRERPNKKRRGAVSPEPIVKDEPVSPPPFHEVPPLGAARPQQVHEPTYIEIDPPREIRYSPAVEKRVEYQRPRQVLYEVDSPSFPREAISYSRTTVREPLRDDQDLRRVASMRNVRAEYPPERVQSVSREQTSYIPHERHSTPTDPYHSIGRSAAYDEMPPSYQRRFVHDPSPVPQSSGVHQEEIQSGEMMPPPVRRVVVDEAGNRFLETIQPARALPATIPGRRVEYERYSHDPASNHVARAGSVIDDPYREQRYVQEMPPPQLTYRRVTDTPQTEMRDRGLFPRNEGEKAPALRSSSVQLIDYSPRQSAYYEERIGPREEVVRVANPRPPPSRYEEPREVIQRVQSVRPGGREVSVFVDDRPQARREYVPVPQPDYEVRRDLQGRYYEIDEGGRMIVGRPQEGRQSVPPRYY